MRVFERLLRWLSTGTLTVLLLLAANPVLAASDTGTYGIADYIVTLEPQNTGDVKITYEQQWQVLSGDIPWITVGLPNSSFSVQDFSGAAAKVSADNSGGFTGVRVDLDKDYLPNQTFNVKFTILQGHLLERLPNENKWRINFTPGSYDRAAINHLQINLISPVEYKTYSLVNPGPGSINGNVITWEQTNLAPGGRFNIDVESLDGNFLTGTSAFPASSSGIPGWLIVVIIGVIILGIYGLIVFAVRQNRKAQEAAVKARVSTIEGEMAADRAKRDKIEKGFGEYVEEKNIQPDAQGRYYDRGYGNYITPAIWAAVISSQYSNRQTNPSTGNVPPSCACACVSCACACACACAGGGAAGCSRKTLHECRTCEIRQLKNQKSKFKTTD
jgi:hypothetical protein